MTPVYKGELVRKLWTWDFDRCFFHLLIDDAEPGEADLQKPTRVHALPPLTSHDKLLRRSFARLGCGNNVPQIVKVVNVSDRLLGPGHSPRSNFFPQTPRMTVALVVDDEIRGTATLNRHKQSCVFWKISAGRRFDGCYNTSLQQPANATVVSRIAIQDGQCPK